MALYPDINAQESSQLLQRLLELQDFLGQVNQAAVQADDENAFLQKVCDLAIERGKLSLAFVARPGEDGWFEFPAAASRADLPKSMLKEVRISYDASRPEGQGPTGRAFREGKTYFNTGYRSPLLAPWREQTQALGLHANAALPLDAQGERYGVLVLYRGDDVVFSPEMRGVLEALACDVARGLEILAVRRLRDTLLDHTPTAITVIRNRIIVHANPAMGHLLGYPADHFTGHSTRLIYAGEAEYQRVGKAYATLESEGQVWVHRVRARHQNGQDLLLELHGRRLDAITSVWTFIDFTQHAHLQGLYRALMHEGSILLTARNETELLDKTCSALVHDTVFHSVWIARPYNNDTRIRGIAMAGSSQPILERLDFPLGDPEHTPLVVQAWNMQHVAYGNTNDTDIKLDDHWRDFFIANRWRSGLAAPVIRGAQPWGVIIFVASERDAFEEDTVATCTRIAELLGHGLDELDLRERLIEQERSQAHRARHDPLTGLPNRLALDEYLPRALARARRAATVLAVGLVDLDDFKPVNDRFGHAAGDVLLKSVTERLQTRLRDTDFLCRLGGDEFVLVLEGFDADQTTTQLERALARLHESVETPFKLGEGRTASAGLSLGLALYPNDGDTPDALLRKADAAMYQVKAHKASRDHWWSLDNDLPVLGSAEDNAQVKDPFGPKAAALLLANEHPLAAVSERFVEALYDDLSEHPEAAGILAQLSAEEMASLKAKQVAHQRFLLAPDTTRAAIEARAWQVGRVHALVGVTADVLIDAVEHYETLLRHEWFEARVSERLFLDDIMSARLNADLRAQLRGHGSVASEVNAYLAKPLPTTEQPEHWIDAIRDELSTVATLPSIAVAAVLQPDEQGVFQLIEACGIRAEAYRAGLEQGGLLPTLDQTSDYGQSTLSEVWRSGQAGVVPSLTKDPRQAPWLALLECLNLRSQAVIPLWDRQGMAEALLLLIGTHPGQFTAAWQNTLLDAFQTRWTTLWRSRKPTQALFLQKQDARLRREALFNGGLEMWMQPVVDLRTGRLAKVEALARLRMPDGKLISPGGFLPLLGERDLRWLFNEGMRIALVALRNWEAQGLRPDLSINLPPAKLLNPDAPTNIHNILQDAGLDPARLILEILETEALYSDTQNTVLEQMTQQGLRFAIDDLGSGYSSLLRLSTLPVSILKIDQGLVRTIPAAPLRRLPLIEALLGLGGRLNLETVIEGLENDALIEMALHMGADYAQGYGIARPMPAEEIPAWTKSFNATFDRSRLKTALGAMTYHQHCMDHHGSELATTLETCPLSDFLTQRDLSGTPMAQAHKALHAGRDIEANHQIILQGLATLVTEEAKET
ncbi:EAL domain-containing protein [Acidihalobacter ferrooxydans]|uniref:Diguanylate cyclase DosC n=1 Tax=Acidihalobacter ferrooxydans TaxID=1765967 RepID=A0A1P8UIN6_9GAMM|nr:EAL domain-containing protein [Acidihalobacter ferrooxydans]APZ43664.1 hypothetical protein BW247_11665 [Acidihalobacter ferrooxydans]